MQNRGMKLSRRKSQRRRGGGWSDNLKNMLYPGGPEHRQYSGPGYDCPGVPVRPGTLSGPGGPGGLPGLSLRGGSRAFTTGATQELAQAGGRRRKTQRRRSQQGGRWQSAPELGALNPSNGVGLASYAPILRAPCETGTLNALNPNPNNVQGLSTAVASVPGWTPMRGGAQKRQQKKKGGSRKQRSQKRKQRKQHGGVQVGQADAMRYYAPTAGYTNAPMAPAVPNNPGILMQLGYPARSFNQGCMATH